MSVSPFHLSESNEHYTPPEIITIARNLLDDDIHFDPTSNAMANCIVGAREYGEVRVDTFRLPWPGTNAFINPPGGRSFREGYPTKSQAAQWLINTHRRIQEGTLQQAVFLAFNLNTVALVPEVSQHQVCFLKKRVQYLFCLEDKIASLRREAEEQGQSWTRFYRDKQNKKIVDLFKLFEHPKTQRCTTKEGLVKHLTPGSSPPHHSALIFMENTATWDSQCRFKDEMAKHGTVL
jgi:hypothetical protein